MTVMNHATLVAVFRDRRAAQRAVDELRRVGFREDQIGVVARDDQAVVGETTTAETGTKWEEGAAVGVAAGAGVGALWALGIAAGMLPPLGPVIAGGLLASVLASAAGGAVTAGILGALVGLGIPEEEARFYEGEFHAGRTIITVRAPGRYEEAQAILRQFGGYDVRTGRGATAASAPAAEVGRTVEVPVTSADVATQGPVSVHDVVDVPAEEIRVPVQEDLVRPDLKGADLRGMNVKEGGGR